MKFASIRNTILQLPPEVLYFLKRAVLIFIAWQLLYYLVLFPTGFPDKQLTDVTAKSTAFLYQQLVNKNTTIDFKNRADGVTIVYLNNKPSVGIADGCNALGLYVLYVSILFCFYAPLKRKIIFSILGCIAIFILNNLRCFLLAWVYFHKMQYFNFAHHYLFAIIIYALIFGMWALYIKRLKHAE